MILLRLDKERYMEHIRDKDQIMNMRRVLDKIEIVLEKHIIQSTDFMDPYERKLARSILNQFTEISYRESGGFKEAERKIILIYPDYYQYDDISIPISSLVVEGYIDRLSHRDFLGGILSLGINREKIGDILIHESCVQIIVKNEIFEFVLINLKRVGKERVDVKQIPLEDLELGKIDYKDIWTTIPSLRLDALISSGLNLSRNESQRLIESRKVKVNWEPIERVFKDVKEGDMISAKGYGRFILDIIEGISRKGRIKVKLRLLK
ncbi:MAG: RNA-binding protein [Tissierellia bacterium]|nr:RNA-binding protein [Tissierellia bacterium]